MSPAALCTLWVGLGGAIGSIARYWLGIAVARLAGEAFPWGTLLINVLGSFVIGYFGMLTLPDGPRPASVDLRIFVMVGLCGGFTTFSAFSLQTFGLFQNGEVMSALAYILASVLLCLLAVALGAYGATGFLSLKI